MEPHSMNLWRPDYIRGDLVWIQLKDGRFFKGQVLGYSVNQDYNRKGKKRYPSRRAPTKLYHVFTLDAKDIQPSAGKRNTVRVRFPVLWPRKEGDLTPIAQVRMQMQQEAREALSDLWNRIQFC